MKSVDRGDFAKGHAYEDSPQLIGYGVTISAPHMVKSIYVLKLSERAAKFSGFIFDSFIKLQKYY